VRSDSPLLGLSQLSGPPHVPLGRFHAARAAANAIECGVLSAPSGQVEVRWWIESVETGGPSYLVFDWIETGAQQPVSAPRPRWFCLSLLEDRLPHDLKVETTLDFTTQGSTCRITLPLTRRLVRSADGIKVEPPEAR